MEGYGFWTRAAGMIFHRVQRGDLGSLGWQLGDLGSLGMTRKVSTCSVQGGAPHL